MSRRARVPNIANTEILRLLTRCLYVGVSTKVSAETMWKVAGLVLSLGGLIAGLVSFLLGLLLKH